MKPLSHPSSLLQTSPPCHHRHQQTRCLGPVQSLQSWTSCSTKVWIWRTKTRGGFSGNSTIRPGFQHQETTTQGTRCKAILRLEPPMYLIYQDPTSATWFPVAILVIPSMSTSLSWIDDRESKAQLEAADHKRNCPSLVEKVTFKSKDNDTNNKTIHVAIFALLLMLINTNIVQISPITSYWHKNPSFFPIEYPCNISTKYPCSKPCTNMLLHQSHIMFYVSTNPPKIIHVSILQYKFMYHSHIIFYLPTNPKKICFYLSILLPQNMSLSIPQICFSIHSTNMYWSHKYASTYQSHKYACVYQSYTNMYHLHILISFMDVTRFIFRLYMMPLL